MTTGASPTLPVPFVGRAAELRRLHDLLRQALANRQPQFVLVRGDFGVGKTALVEHFMAEAPAVVPGVLLGRSKCALETESNGLVPFSELLVSLAGAKLRRRVFSAKLAAFLKEVAPAWLDVFSFGQAGTLIKAGSKTLDEGRKLFDAGAASQENTFIQFANALRRLAGERPVVAFIDDLQWADNSSLRLLFHLARHLQDRTVLWVAAYRPVEALETGPNAALFQEIRANLLRYGAAEIELDQGIDVAAFVAQRYAPHALPAEFVARVQERTEGHAFFVSQLFALWETNGVIAPRPAPDGPPVWNLVRAADVDTIPQTLGDVLEGRIRPIAPELRELLTYAAVEGEDFTVQAVARLCQLESVKALESLEILASRYHLVRERPPRRLGDVTLNVYRFVHRFFREYLYHQVGEQRRSILHRQVGECLEMLYEDRRPIAGQLAHHFRRSGDERRAAGYALLAAQVEHARFAWTEGEQWCRLGLDLLGACAPGDPRLGLQLDLTEQMALGYYNASRYPQANAAYHDALALAAQLPAPVDRRVAILSYLADICGYQGDTEAGAAFLEQAKALLAEQAVPFGVRHLALESGLASVEGHRGESERAIERLRTALVRAAELEQTLIVRRSRSGVYNMLGYLLNNLGRYREAAESYQQAIALAQQSDDADFEANCWLNLADNYLESDTVAQALTYAVKGLRLGTQVGDMDKVAYAHAIRGRACAALGRYTEAVTHLSRAVNLFGELNSRWYLPYVHADLSWAHWMLGDSARAVHNGHLAVGAAGTNRHERGYALDTLARMEAAQGQWPAAEAHFGEAIAIHEQAGHRRLLAGAQCHLAAALAERGAQQRAADLLEQAIATLQALELTGQAAAAQAQLTALRGAATAGAPAAG